MQIVKRLTTATMTALWLFNGAVLTQGTQAADAPPQAATAAAKAAADKFPPEQLEQLVAPIALYPDALLAQLFMAATYPLDIVQADRWLGDNEGLEGEALEKAAAEQRWDPSVQALVFFPSVLGYMSDNLNWTQDLGDAVLAQQNELMDAVQRLRKEAQTAGTLTSNAQQQVESKGETIVVQSADPKVVYVPSYNPAQVYGQTAEPITNYYPSTYSTPVYVPETTVVPTDTVATTSSTTDSLLTFGAGALAGGLLTAAIMWDNHDDGIWYGGRGYYGGGGYWGGSNYWNNGWNNGNAINRDIDVNRNIDRSRNISTGDINVNKGIVGNEINAGKWEHNAANRGGVRYRDKDVRTKYDSTRRDARISGDGARGRDPGKLGDGKRPEGGRLGDTSRLEGGNKLGDTRRPDGGGKLGDGKRSDGGNKLGDGKRPNDGGKASGAKTPKTREAKVQKPATKAARPDGAKAQRPPKTDGAKASGFKPQAGNLDRAASQRGAASRGGGGLPARTGGGGAAKSFGGGGSGGAAKSFGGGGSGGAAKSFGGGGGGGGARAAGGGGGGGGRAAGGGGGRAAGGGGGRGGGGRR